MKREKPAVWRFLHLIKEVHGINFFFNLLFERVNPVGQVEHLAGEQDPCSNFDIDALVGIAKRARRNRKLKIGIISYLIKIDYRDRRLAATMSFLAGAPRSGNLIRAVSYVFACVPFSCSWSA